MLRRGCGEVAGRARRSRCPRQRSGGAARKLWSRVRMLNANLRMRSRLLVVAAQSQQRACAWWSRRRETVVSANKSRRNAHCGTTRGHNGQKETSAAVVFPKQWPQERVWIDDAQVRCRRAQRRSSCAVHDNHSLAPFLILAVLSSGNEDSNARRLHHTLNQPSDSSDHCDHCSPLCTAPSPLKRPLALHCSQPPLSPPSAMSAQARNVMLAQKYDDRVDPLGHTHNARSRINAQAQDCEPD